MKIDLNNSVDEDLKLTNSRKKFLIIKELDGGKESGYELRFARNFTSDDMLKSIKNTEESRQ